MIDQKQIDLIIRAQVKNARDIESIGRSIAELSTAIDRQSKAAKNGEASIDQLKASMLALQAVEADLKSQVGALSAFQKLATDIQKTEERVTKARTAFTEYQAKLAGLSEVTDAQQQRLTRLNDSLQRGEARLDSQRQKFQTYGAALREAGIDTNNLAAAEDRLRAIGADLGAAYQRNNQAIREYDQDIRRARASTDSLSRASSNLRPQVQSLGDAIQSINDRGRKAGGGFSFFNDEGRTTLSLTQRIRGEILALAAAYVGLQGVIGVAAGAIRSFNQAQALQSQLGFAFGNDTALIGQQVAFVREQTDRIGLSLEAASKSYGRFAAAAVRSGATVQQTQFIFESFGEAAAVLRLTPDQLDGIFNALGQSFSKGRIQAEELRQQIGERLPGAFQFAQEALRDIFPDLNKALEQGLVDAKFLPIIAESVRKAAGESLPAAIKSLTAEQNRFNNAILDFQKAIAEAGFADAYTQLLRELTVFFRSEDGKVFAESIAAAFTTLIDVVRALLANIEEVKLALTIIAGVVGANLFAKLIASIGLLIGPLLPVLNGLFVALAALLKGQVAAAAVIAAGAIRGAAVAMTLLQKATIVLAALFAAWQIGEYVYKNFIQVRLAVIEVVGFFQRAWVEIRSAAQIAIADLPTFFQNAFVQIVNFTTLGVRSVLGVLARLAETVGLDTISKGIQTALTTLTLQAQESTNSRVAELKRQRDEDLAAIRRSIDEQRDAQIRAEIERQVGPARRTASTTGLPGDRPTRASGPTEGDIAKRERSIKSIEDALNALDARIERSQRDSLRAQLQAFETDTLKLQRRISEVGGKEAIELQKRLEELKGQMRLQITRQFNEKLLQEQESLNAKLDQAEAAAGRKDRESLQSRLDAIEAQYAATYRDIAALRIRLLENDLPTTPADNAENRLNAATSELKRIEIQADARRRVNIEETKFNELLQLREQRIAAVRAQESAGLLDNLQATEQINAINAELTPRILTAIQATRDLALANREAFANPELFATFIAQLDAITAKVQAQKTEFNALQQVAIQAGVNIVGQGLNSIADGLTAIFAGQKSISGAFKDLGRTFLQFAADFLRQIAIMIIQMAIFRALANSGIPGLSQVGQAGMISMRAGVRHSGGIVGSIANRERDVSPLWFANAPRYHAGGFVGMATNEYPAILKKNEEVLSDSDPRNALNGGLAAGRGGQQGSSTRFVLVDDRSRVTEAMSASDGEEVVLMHLKANLPTLRQWIKGS